jgi:hypothetical protein
MWTRRIAGVLFSFSVAVLAGCGSGGSQASDAAADHPAGSAGAGGIATGGVSGSGGAGGSNGGASGTASGGTSGTGGLAATGGASVGSGGSSAGGGGGAATAGRGGAAGRGGGGGSAAAGGAAQAGGRGGNTGGGGKSAAGGAGNGGGAGGKGGTAAGGGGKGGAGTAAGGDGGGRGGAGGTPALATGTCTVPCALKFGANPNANLAQGAILYVNLTTGAAQLRDSDVNPPAGTTELMQFEFDPTTGSNHGYHLWFSGGNLWDEWTEPYEYDTAVGMYSVKQFLPITMQMVETAANKLVLLTFYLVDRGVVVQSVRFPSCTTGTGVCRNATDCPIVNAGSAGPVATNCDMTCTTGLSCATQCTSTGSGLSLTCSDCYARFFACSRTMCPGQFECPTPRLAGNGCLRCQVDKGCARAFMTCSGLDHMPMGTLLLPLPN